MTLYDASTVTYSSAAVTYDGGTASPSPYPLPGIYIAFDDSPYTASPAWTEITQYVRGFSTHRGRSSDFDQFDTGTAQLVLDNRDRRFDPFYTSGPYYGKLLPRRQIRIIGQAGGTNYDVFRGYIAGWPVTWSEAGKDSTVTIQAFDALGLMANEILPTDWVSYYTSTLSPIHYWRFNDGARAATVKDYAGTLDVPASTANPFYEVQPMAAGILANGLYAATSTSIVSPTPGGTSNTRSFMAWSMGFFTGTASAQYNIYITRGGIRLELQVYSNAAPTIQVSSTTRAPRSFTLSAGGGALPNFNAPTHWAISYNNTSDTLTVYANNVLLTATPGAAFGVPITDSEAYVFYTVGIQEVSVYDRILSATEIGLIYNISAARLAETTTARMNRLVGTTDFASTLTAFTSAPVATVSEIGSGAGVIPEMQLVADSEGGELYVSKSGVLTTTARFDVFNATRSATTQATITDSGAGLEYGTELLIEYDADNLKNDITVQFSGNGEVNAYSDALIETYGGAATTIETQLADPTSANQLALLELGVEGALVPRISPIDLTPNTAASDWQTILGLELLDRVTFKRTPTVGNQFSRDALINAIDHQVVPGVWNTQVTLSMRYTSPLTLDDDVLGTLDFNYLG